MTGPASTGGEAAPLLRSKAASRATSAYASVTPRDEYNAAYLSFLLLGAGFLFPWNAVITAVGFFNQLFPGKGIEFYFSVCYMTTNLMGLVFVVKWGDRLSFRSRIVTGFIIFLGCIIALPFITNMTLTLAIVCILGTSDAIVQGSIYGLSGQFHPRFIGAVMAGNGIAGLAVSLLRVMTKLIIPGESHHANEMSAILYFSLSAAVIVACILAYVFVLERSPVTKFYLDKTREERNEQLSKLSQQNAPLSVAGSAAYLPTTVSGAAADLPFVHDAPGATRADKAMASANADAEAGAAGVVQKMNTQSRGPIAVFMDVWPQASSVGFSFFVTLALFPGITSKMTSTHFSEASGWYPIILITLFNACDLTGRTLPKWDSLIIVGPKSLPWLTLARIVFIPLFLLSLHPKVFVSDVWMYIFMIGMGLTNGYAGTLLMMFGPDRVGIFDKEQAGTVMVFCLTIGLTAGVWMGVLLNNWF